jgi:hypothetical protein
MIQTGHNEGLKLARLLMVLSSVSPLFILWAIRGTALIPDVYFLTFCAAMVVGPNAFLWYRIRIARQRDDTRELAVAAVEDNREHLLVYLFAILLPFYADTLATAGGTSSSRGGKAQLQGKGGEAQSSKELSRLQREIERREQVIGELTIANRILLSGPSL